MKSLIVRELRQETSRLKQTLAGEGELLLDRNKVRQRFDADLRSGFFIVHPLRTSILGARRRIADGEPQATLEALQLHFATALEANADVLATNDGQLPRAARAAELRVETVI